jgi:membrane protease YdiL (CAAX protease family)
MLATALGGAAVVAMAWFWPGGTQFGRPGAALLAPLTYPLFLGLWIPLLVLYSAVLLRMQVGFPPQPILQAVAERGLPPPQFVALLAGICLFGPLVEEILFRGYLQSALRATAGAPGALVLTSALFGLMHGAVYAFPTGLLGLWFGWLRERTGGLAAPYAAHALHNSLIVAITLLWPDSLELLFQEAR